GRAEVEPELPLRLALGAVAFEARRLEDRPDVAVEVDGSLRLSQQQQDERKHPHGVFHFSEMRSPARFTRTATSANIARGRRRDGAEIQIVAITSPCGPRIGAAMQWIPSSASAKSIEYPCSRMRSHSRARSCLSVMVRGVDAVSVSRRIVAARCASAMNARSSLPGPLL